MVSADLSQRLYRSFLVIAALMAVQYAVNTSQSTTSTRPETLSYRNWVCKPAQVMESRSLRKEDKTDDASKPPPTDVRIFSSSRIDNAKTRTDRFPTVEERVLLYMGDWYLPPCPDRDPPVVASTVSFCLHPSETGNTGKTDAFLPEYFGQMPIISNIRPDTLFVFDADSLQQCLRDSADRNATNAEKNMKMYCQDAIDRMVPIVDDAERSNVPTLVQFGDKRRSHGFGRVTVPYFKKYRPSRSHREIKYLAHRGSCVTGVERLRQIDDVQPIIWKLEIGRHYGLLPLVPENDIPWEDKVDKAIFRGQPTGTKPEDEDISDIDFCASIPRCRLVHDNIDSTLVDAILTRTVKRLPEVLSDGTRIVGPKMNITELLKYKAIVMMEGNDIASGLKWALLSQSVVIMPRPRYTSWAMEELLEPWVHYIPIDDTGSNLEERMQWVLDNDEEARRIAERGTLWMQDLMLHEDAERDARLVEAESLRRYRAHFREGVMVKI